MLIWLAYSITIAYFGAKFISKTEHFRKLFLFDCIILLLIPLILFKYIPLGNFASQSLKLTWLIIPLGISYYTFSLIGYVIDVYRKKLEPVKNIGKLSVFAFFFPAIISGPVARASQFFSQLESKKTYTHKNMVSAFTLFTFGLFLKVVVATRAAFIVEHVYSSLASYTFVGLTSASIAFYIQLFADFGGYSFMALAIAKAFGIEIINNFNQPAISTSVADFWKRWHISLSNWFQDYVFTPLYLKTSKLLPFVKQTSTKHMSSFGISIIIGFTALGIWHGSGWKFLIYGTYFGILVFLTYAFRSTWAKIPRILQILLTHLLVIIGLVIFRLNSISEVKYFFSHIILGPYLTITAVDIGIEWLDLIILMTGTLIIILSQLIEAKHKLTINEYICTRPKKIIWLYGIIFIMTIIIFGIFNASEFIYFKF
jgi:D-alanyl-lipoteichoic acid acyltransferase DltB (MBOAT superfamily)